MGRMSEKNLRDTGVDGSFASGYRHVGGVGNQASALHDRFLAAVNFD